MTQLRTQRTKDLPHLRYTLIRMGLPLNHLRDLSPPAKVQSPVPPPRVLKDWDPDILVYPKRPETNHQ